MTFETFPTYVNIRNFSDFNFRKKVMAPKESARRF